MTAASGAAENFGFAIRSVRVGDGELLPLPGPGCVIASTADTSATATPSTWKPTDSASSTTPSDPTKHWQTGPRNRPTSQERPPKTCQLLDSRHESTDKFSGGELQVMPHDEEWVP